MGEALLVVSTGDPTGFGYVAPDRIANSAGGPASPLAPGQLLSLFVEQLGPDPRRITGFDDAFRLPVNAGGTEVSFDGVPAPILYAGAFQINVQVPYSLVPGSKSTIQVWFRGVPSNRAVVDVVDAAPEIFHDFATGSAIALNEDGLREHGLESRGPRQHRRAVRERWRRDFAARHRETRRALSPSPAETVLRGDDRQPAGNRTVRGRSSRLHRPVAGERAPAGFDHRGRRTEAGCRHTASWRPDKPRLRPVVGSLRGWQGTHPTLCNPPSRLHDSSRNAPRAIAPWGDRAARLRHFPVAPVSDRPCGSKIRVLLVDRLFGAKGGVVCQFSVASRTPVMVLT